MIVKAILPFDDFLMNRSDNTKRVLKQPHWHPECVFTDSEHTSVISPQVVVPAPQGGYMLIYMASPDENIPMDDEHMAVLLAHSDDGFHFEPCHVNLPDMKRANMIGMATEDIGIHAMLDAQETNPDYRYKAPQARYGRIDSQEIIQEPAHLLGSPDLIHWKRISDAPVTPSYVDCYPSLLRNPRTGRFQVTTRRRWGERRICLTESADLQSWTFPRGIVHPLPNDEPTTHLYSMPEYYYEPGDMFIGLLWKQVMPFNRVMDGPVTSEYAYSYDGLMWNRTNAPLYTAHERGELGYGGAYCISMVDRGEDILFYMAAHRAEHGGFPKPKREGLPANVAVVPGTLKRNRFVCIDSGKGKAELITQWLRLNQPELRINANIPFGGLRAELRRGAPIEGYTMDDFIPLSGDLTDAPLRWKGGGLERFVRDGSWVQLYIAFEQAEIYGIMGDFAFNINTRAPAYENL